MNRAAAVKREEAEFAKVLKQFGFKKLADKNVYGETMNCYANDKNQWFADILNFGTFAEVWMVGKGLKDTGSFPGGYNYGTAEHVKTELTKAIKTID